MVTRWFLRTTVAALLVLSGCTGLIDVADPTGDDTDAAPPEPTAQELWITKALPTFQAAQCVNCHISAPVATNYWFLAGTTADEQRATILASREVNMDTPSNSLLLNRGAHEGSALTMDQYNVLLEWLQKEQSEATIGPGEVILKTTPITVQKCAQGQLLAACPVNTINLADITGAGLDGTITFKAPLISGMLYANELTLNGGTTGAYLEHMLFVAVPPANADGTPDNTTEPVADSIDRYDQIKFNVAAAATTPIEGGTAGFSGFPDTFQVIVSFKVAGVYKPGGPVTADPGACKSLATFKTSAQATMTTNCGNACHLGANPAAKAAMDLTGINTTDDTKIAIACAQVKSRTVLATPAMSGIFLAPTPGNTNHPFNFGGNQANFTAFRTSVTTWITAEAAP
ncbi:MAG TPA: hypothetical protein VGM90_32575 [Kofleriaceae bacterium]|jgi:hypothetical protein